MGATSVTGVGTGSAAGLTRGNEHMSLGVASIIGPKVVAAGRIALSGTTGVVNIPVQNGSVSDYVVMLTATSNSHCYVSSNLASVDNTDEWHFTITGGSGSVVNYSVVKTGFSNVKISG